MKKNQQYTLIYLRSNAVSSVFLLHDLDLHFRFQMLKYVKFVRFRLLLGAKIMKKNQPYTFKHLPSNGVNSVFLLPDLDLPSEGHKIFYFNFSETFK